MTSFRQAFSLSADEVKNASPPGTVGLISHTLERTQTGQDVMHDELQLNPRPSLDPADPLNWPLWRKYAILACMSLFPFVSNFASASIASTFPIYETPAVFMPPPSFSQLTRLISVNVLMMGASNIWWTPLANTFGRRPIMLISLLLLTLASMWAGLAKSFDSLLAARLFMGIGGGPADAVAPDVVGEVFFVHQRGRAMAIYTVFLTLGPLVGGTAGGYIAASRGILWIHWVNVILCGSTFILCLFFQPETLFDRRKALSLSYGSPSEPAEQNFLRDEKTVVSNIERGSSPASFRPYTFGRSLGFSSSRGGLLHQLLAPYPTLRLPGVWLVMFWYSGLIAGIVTMSTVGPTIVASPPYLWGENAGLINIGGIIGAFLGVIYTYFTSDFLTKRMAKKEIHGYSEAESRLGAAIPALAVSTAGIILFGFCAQYPGGGFNLRNPATYHHSKQWIGLEFGLGMVSFGLMQAPSIGFTYIIDSYNAVSGDCFVMITCFRAIISFAWTFFVGEWIDSSGAAEPFGIFGLMMGVAALLTIPMMIWGKRTRIATAKWIPAHSDH